MLYTQCKKTYFNKVEVSFNYQPIYRVIDISNSAINVCCEKYYSQDIVYKEMTRYFFLTACQLGQITYAF